MRPLAFLVVLAGCRQLIGIDDPVVAPPDGEVTDADAVVDVAPDVPTALDCPTRWAMGPVFGPPVKLATISTGGSDEDHPFVTEDELTIYFSRNGDIYRATRTSISSDFGAATAESSLNTAKVEGKVFVTADGLRAFFASDRGPQAAGFDLYRGARASAVFDFSVDTQYVNTLNSGGPDEDPFLTPDLLQIYFTQQSNGQTRITQAERNNTSQSFGNAHRVFGGSRIESSPSLALGQTLLVFAVQDSDGSHIYYSKRASTTATFTTATPLDLGASVAPASPHISADGCRIYFSRRDFIAGDLYVATML